MIQVELDDKKIDLPEIEGVVVLNISSWGGGCEPWAGGDAPTARWVVAVKSLRRTSNNNEQ